MHINTLIRNIRSMVLYTRVSRISAIIFCIVLFDNHSHRYPLHSFVLLSFRSFFFDFVSLLTQNREQTTATKYKHTQFCSLFVRFQYFNHIIECLQFLFFIFFFVYFITVIVGVVCVCFNDIQMSLNSHHSTLRVSFSLSLSLIFRIQSFFFMVECYNLLFASKGIAKKLNRERTENFSILKKSIDISKML